MGVAVFAGWAVNAVRGVFETHGWRISTHIAFESGRSAFSAVLAHRAHTSNARFVCRSPGVGRTFAVKAGLALVGHGGLKVFMAIEASRAFIRLSVSSGTVLASLTGAAICIQEVRSFSVDVLIGELEAALGSAVVAFRAGARDGR